MRQAIGLPSLLLTVTLLLTAQQPAVKSIVKTPEKPPAAHTLPGASSQLPVTRVALYKDGVGFFEHEGRVTGNQSVTIDFTTAQLNDVLQSLTAIDLNGGRIAGAGYNSTTPLEQQLKSLPLALGEDPTAVDFYNAIRGARVEVRSGTATITGRLLSIEVVNTPEGDNKPAAERRLITVIGDTGEMRTVELTSASEVRLLDADLHQDITRYLELLASTRNQGLRHLTLEDKGTGSRELHVSYISEVPIWKSTYRILFTEPASSTSTKQTATLQGWSVVDNTSGADWINVQLSLIAGAPQSFIQPLSVPYYSRRPEIGLPQEAQLTPQTHESGEDKAALSGQQGQANGFTAGQLPAATGVAGRIAGKGASVVGQGGYIISDRDTKKPSTVGGDSTELITRLPGFEYQSQAADSISPNASTAAFDDYFAYNLTEPITIRKNESALVPILQTKVDAERVTLWSPRQPTPLRALWITNTSNLTLDRGSFTIVEDGNFGGQGLLDPIHPAEKRLLSYAVDQAVRVSTDNSHSTHRVERITVSKGVLRQTTLDINEVEYLVHNAAPDARTVIVEHPVRNGWMLDSDPKPTETTPTVDRFRVETKAGETVRLHIGERHPGTSVYTLTNSDDNQLTFILNQTGNNAAIKQALQPILEARGNVADMQAALDKVTANLNSLRADEERQRANITALANADKSSRDRFVRELNTTEDQIAAAEKNLTSAEANLQAGKDALANKIESLQIDETI